MYQKNTSGQHLGFALVNAATGGALTGATVTAVHGIDSAAQVACTGTTTELGGGQYIFALSAADTNGNNISYLFTATSAVPVEKTIVTTAANPTDGVHFGLSALPNTACTTNASLLTSGSGTDQINVSSGKLLLQATQTGVTIPMVTTVGTLTTYTGDTPQTGDCYARLGVPSGATIDADILSRLASSGYTPPPTAAAIATSIWTDTTAGDFTTASSPGKILLSQLGGAFTTSSSSVLSTASLVNAPVTSAAPTAAAVATAVWTDLTSTSDFAAAGSAGAFIKASTAQTGDSFARIGSTGSGLTSLAPASTALSTAQWTSTRASNLDNLDAAISTRSTYAGGVIASVAGSVGSIAGVTFPTHFSSLAIDASGRIDVGHVLGVASAGEAGYVGLDWGQVANLASTNNMSNTTISTGQTIQTVTGNVGGSVGGVNSAVTVGSSEDKTGYSLASTGLDSINVAAPMGVATTFPGMLIQVWRRFFKASAKSAFTLKIETFADDGTTVVTTQGYTDDGAGTESLSGSS